MRRNKTPLSEIDSDQRSLTPVHTSLKWFNKAKGFGFVNPVDDEEIDAFIHITTLLKADCQKIGDGAELECIIQEGPKGWIVREVTNIISVGDITKNSDGDDNADDMMQTNPLDQIDESELEDVDGEVKWYRPEKGFGFIVPNDNPDKDVFIHKYCLQRQGVDLLDAGQKLSMKVRVTPKGREVISFEIL